MTTLKVSYTFNVSLRQRGAIGLFYPNLLSGEFILELPDSLLSANLIQKAYDEFRLKYADTYEINSSKCEEISVLVVTQ